MKVYVVIELDYDSTWPKAIFATKDAAESFADAGAARLKGDRVNWEVQEFEVRAE